MARYLHSLSGFLFYVLAGSLFFAYVLLHNDAGGALPGLWLRIADLPLLLVGVLYGGLSVYGSVREEGTTSKTLAVLIALPLIAVFCLFVILNFWDKIA